MTKTNKEIIAKFWEAWKVRKHAAKYGAKKDAIIRHDLELQEIISEISSEDLTNEKFASLFLGYKNGQVVTNKYGAKLFFKRG